jgi:UPF0042 nucleotide-binding protein
MKLVIITGLSGSGKSTALHTLEDLGYYCIDNLPVFLLRTMGAEMAQSDDPAYELAAVGIDARNQARDLHRLPAMVDELRCQGIDCQIMFLEARDEVLLRRFSETRRKHPLTDPDRPLGEAIQLERELLEPLLGAADLCIDSSKINIHELRDLIRQRLIDSPAKGVSLLLESFGYKHGIPIEANFVYDARCLPNPHWDEALRPLTGRDQPVADFLGQNEKAQRLLNHISTFLEQWIPAFEKEGRCYLTVAIGCTGGQHRSVYLVEQLARHFQAQGQNILVRHRELP